LTIKPIKSDEELDAALREISRIFHAKPGTRDGDRVEILTLLVEAYEKEHYPMPPPDPIDAIKFHLDQQGTDAKALIGIIGNRTRVYEVMRGDRPLTLAMIRRLHEAFGIPAEILIRPAKVRSRRARTIPPQKKKAA
jgi:HTH-type transcriptional regulator/antitoxin HigA